MSVPRVILDQIKRMIPPLDGSLHKGQSGRVGVLGGALDYTGAPYFAAISALRFGVDLSHVICSPSAAGAIKSYSPDLIVHPMLREDVAPEKIRPELESLFSRLHVLVIGPGLGREEYMQSFARLAITLARKRGMYLVLDADALLLIGQDVSLIRGYRRAVLTPNVVEFKRLSEQLGVVDPDVKAEDRAALISKKLGGATVLQKGAVDMIATDTTGEEADANESKVDSEDNAREIVKVDTTGGLKRCGGQGDVLSGSVGAMLAWGKCYENGAFGDKSLPVSRMPILAAVAASMVTRTASRLAFADEGRGVVTQDMLPKIGKAFAEVFGEDAQGGSKGKL